MKLAASTLPGTRTHHGPGPFVTLVTAVLADGRHLIATSRRHRKGLAPRLFAEHVACPIPPTQREAWLHLWAPHRLAWWVAVLFFVGSAHFAFGGWATTWPADTPAPLRPAATTNLIFFVGSLFFTSAAYLQLLEAANGDVANALGPRPTDWLWFGWKPRNLGWLASAIQLVGTVAFNVDTGDAMIAGLNWEQEDVFVWSPNMFGCGCFLIASLLAWVELSHGAWSFAPRSASWWSVVANSVGSVAFQLSAFASFVRPGVPDAHELWLAAFSTFAGGVGFLVGSYLLIPEVFEGETQDRSVLDSDLPLPQASFPA